MTQPRQPTKHERRKTNIVTGKPKAKTALMVAIVIAMALPATTANPIEAATDDLGVQVTGPQAQGLVFAYPYPYSGDSTEQCAYAGSIVTSLGNAKWYVDWTITYTTNWGEPGSVSGKSDEFESNAAPSWSNWNLGDCGPWKHCTITAVLHWYNGNGFQEHDDASSDCLYEENVE